MPEEWKSILEPYVAQPGWQGTPPEFADDGSAAKLLERAVPDHRERLWSFFADGLTLDLCGKRFQVSKQRIRQLLTRWRRDIRRDPAALQLVERSLLPPGSPYRAVTAQGPGLSALRVLLGLQRGLFDKKLSLYDLGERRWLIVDELLHQRLEPIGVALMQRGLVVEAEDAARELGIQPAEVQAFGVLSSDRFRVAGGGRLLPRMGPRPISALKFVGTLLCNAGVSGGTFEQLLAATAALWPEAGVPTWRARLAYARLRKRFPAAAWAPLPRGWSMAWRRRREAARAVPE